MPATWRIIRPAPASIVRLSAIWMTTRPSVQRRESMAPVVPRPSLAERAGEADLRRVQCGRKATEHRRPEADRGDECEDAAFDRESQPVRFSSSRGRELEETHAKSRERQPGGAGDEREQQALGEELTDDLPARRAERQAHRDLARAGGAARQQQVGDVGAGDEQQEDDRAHESREHRPDRPAGGEVAKGPHERGDVRVR